VGTTTLADSLQATKEPGIVCMAGMVGNQWSLPQFAPMDVIPTGVSLTTYSGGVADFMAMPLQELVDQVEAGVLPIRLGPVFQLDQISSAHAVMEQTSARGKIVVMT
jgi:NADPH:quinone reductase-like Zn-dependent oxidoreductase